MKKTIIISKYFSEQIKTLDEIKEIAKKLEEIGFKNQRKIYDFFDPKIQKKLEFIKAINKDFKITLTPEKFNIEFENKNDPDIVKNIIVTLLDIIPMEISKTEIQISYFIEEEQLAKEDEIFKSVQSINKDNKYYYFYEKTGDNGSIFSKAYSKIISKNEIYVLSKDVEEKFENIDNIIGFYNKNK